MFRQSFLALGIAALALVLFGQAQPAGAETPAVKAEAHEKPASAGDIASHNAAEAAHEADPDIKEPQPGLVIWTVVVFVGLLIILGKFAWKPLIAALHQREAHLEHVLLDTEKARNESERLLAEHRRQMTEAEDRARALLEEARGLAKTSAEQILQQARTEAEAEKSRAKQDIESARDQALGEIWSKTADLAVSVAGKVLAKELNPQDHRRLFDLATAELPAAPASTNGHGSHV